MSHSSIRLGDRRPISSFAGVDAKKPNGGKKQPSSEQLATSSSSEGSASPPSCAADTISVERNETLETNLDGVIRSLRQDLAADDIEAKLRAYLSLPGLSEHHFMPLMQYSLLRAFMANATVVGIDMFLFADDASLSPWTNQNPFVSTAKASHTLTPSAVQLATPHHPYLDVLAPPSLRDNILLANLNDDEEERLCMTFHKGAFTIWGSQPWNLNGKSFTTFLHRTSPRILCIRLASFIIDLRLSPQVGKLHRNSSMSTVGLLVTRSSTTPISGERNEESSL